MISNELITKLDNTQDTSERKEILLQIIDNCTLDEGDKEILLRYKDELSILHKENRDDRKKSLDKKISDIKEGKLKQVRVIGNHTNIENKELYEGVVKHPLNAYELGEILYTDGPQDSGVQGGGYFRFNTYKLILKDDEIVDLGSKSLLYKEGQIELMFEYINDK